MNFLGKGKSMLLILLLLLCMLAGCGEAKTATEKKEETTIADSSEEVSEPEEFEGAHDSDMEALSKMIKENDANNIVNGDCYVWEDGRLTEIHWDNTGLRGDLSIEGLGALKVLECSRTQLSSLRVSNCLALTSLNCSVALLSSLDISGCPTLTSLYCNGNQLSYLDISGYTALTELDSHGNQLR